MEPEWKYWAFISYSHTDNREPGRQWASWLQQTLETYDVPSDLVGEINQRGEVIPERIFPVCRDEADLPTAASLTEAVRLALKGSRSLIVVCSPRAAKSHHVQEEILYFKQLGREERIVAVVIDGSLEDALPDALRRPMGADGVIGPVATVEPLAADLRLEDGRSQGFTNIEAYREALVKGRWRAGRPISRQVAEYGKKLGRGVNKVVAGVLGVSLTQVEQRSQAYQSARKRRRAMILAASLVAVLLAVAAAVWGWNQRQLLLARGLIAEANRQRLTGQDAGHSAALLRAALEASSREEVRSEVRQGGLPAVAESTPSQVVAAHEYVLRSLAVGPRTGRLLSGSWDGSC